MINAVAIIKLNGSSSESQRNLSGRLPFPSPSKECHFYPPWGDDSAGAGLLLYGSRHRPFAGGHHIPWLGTKSKQLDTAKCEKEADTWNVIDTICYLFQFVWKALSAYFSFLISDVHSNLLDFEEWQFPGNYLPPSQKTWSVPRRE